MRTGLKRTRWLLGLLAVSAAAGIVFVLWLNWGPNRQPAPEDLFRLPPYSTSRFLNTGADAQYVGIDACAKCHTSNHESYLLTAHSRALAEVDPKTEPPDGLFYHQASGHYYRVYRQDGQLRHEEILRTAEGKEISRVDLPIRYRVGSGHFARTYVVEVDGFLHESPITWYVSKNQWGMSPGYDIAKHWGFERAINVACLSCHAGRVDAASTVNHSTLVEKAIGCESCHGPGSLHAAFHEANKTAPGAEDLTIVNPGKLSRPQLEAVCGACHLNGPARTYLRGRQVTDFRPGMPLTDYRIDYRFDTGSEQMTVVGHMEQLRQSKCYQKSNDMTCLTCHDPHERAKPKEGADTTAFYRQKCLECHTTRAPTCSLDVNQRLQKDATDNCAACHMPRGNTDITHVAFTHHRIGLHGSKPPSETTRVPELVPVEDDSHLTELDQLRNRGLAYMEAARKPEYSKYAQDFAHQARIRLEPLEAAGLRDAETSEALADIYLKPDPARSRAYARQVLEGKDASAEVRANALIQLATCEMQDRNYSSALPLLRELVRLRRGSEDWQLFGIYYLALRQPREALTALKQALAIRPDIATVHALLAQTYRQLGDVQRAKEHQEKAQWLQRPK